MCNAVDARAFCLRIHELSAPSVARPELGSATLLDDSNSEKVAPAMVPPGVERSKVSGPRPKALASVEANEHGFHCCNVPSGSARLSFFMLQLQHHYVA